MDSTKTMYAGVIGVFMMASLSGCITPQRPMTADELAIAQQMQQAFLARLQGVQPDAMVPGSPPMAQYAQQQPVLPLAQAVTQVLSEEALSAKLEVFAGVATPTTIVRARDAIRFGAQVFLDPEGEIVNFAANDLNGDVTYLARLADERFAVRYVRAGSDAEPVTLGHAHQQPNGWTFNTVTGKTLSGDRLIPTSRGVLVTRDASAFRYTPGEGTKSIVAAEGYHVAQFQNGDVASTGYILLEKTPVETRNAFDQFSELAAVVKKTVGMEERDDYVLMNIRTGQLVKFDKGTYSNKVAVSGTNCKVQSKTLGISKCDDIDYKESLYEPNGSPNDEHYFWSLFWFNTPDGPYAIAKEAGTKKVTITELNTGRKTVLFERMLGINRFEATQAPTGAIRVVAQLGFSVDEVPDAVAFFRNHAGAL